MINLLDTDVKHKSFGMGKVVEQTEAYIKIEFAIGIKQFQFPEAFEKFLQCKETNKQDIILEILVIKKEELERVKKEEQSKIIKARQVPVKVNRAKQKSCQKENIAFKCNFCDGGLSENGMGYVCACSDEMINYNIDVAHHSWCSNEESPCRQYYDGLISREELDNIIEGEDASVCYESQMLRNWTAFAGFSWTKGNEPKPMTLKKVQVNSLSILTTREPYTDEKDRFVFGVFLVDEAYEGDNREAGYVTTTSKYKLNLTMEEAKKVLFWNYYHNENAPEKVAWGQGLHRYITDIQAASILWDIVNLKKGTTEESLAQEFLEYFCAINNVDVSEFPIMEGALQR